MTIHKCDRCRQEKPVYRVEIRGNAEGSSNEVQHIPSTIFELCRDCQKAFMLWCHTETIKAPGA